MYSDLQNVALCDSHGMKLLLPLPRLLGPDSKIECELSLFHRGIEFQRQCYTTTGQRQDNIADPSRTPMFMVIWD